ncbi:hypothetical protein QAD02_007803 [Eretmocerus hayati]|uniref:Uncharacterized protein n=1 Tax=Eretmocerus hayati TaxID=131215 RepID=A0ACC2N501_9HYME|nr:hypothetical protein QAD02_007803 [Eretmocerus hayati]
MREGGPRTQISILKSSRETQSSSESLTSCDESEAQEFDEPPIPQRDKSFLPDLLDKDEESNPTDSHLNDLTPKKGAILRHQTNRSCPTSLHQPKTQLAIKRKTYHTISLMTPILLLRLTRVLYQMINLPRDGRRIFQKFRNPIKAKPIGRTMNL